MAKMSRRKLEEIVKRDAPGSKLVPTESAPTDAAGQPHVDQVTPDLEELRQKYLGDDADAEPEPEAAADDAPEAPADKVDDDEIVAIQQTNVADPLDAGTRPKAVVISGSEGKIIGTQG